MSRKQISAVVYFNIFYPSKQVEIVLGSVPEQISLGIYCGGMRFGPAEVRVLCFNMPNPSAPQFAWWTSTSGEGCFRCLEPIRRY